MKQVAKTKTTKLTMKKTSAKRSARKAGVSQGARSGQAVAERPETEQKQSGWRGWLFLGGRQRKPLTARGMFNMIILIFTIGCVFGAYWEEILHMVTVLCTTGTFDWEPRRGLVYGPFSPIYGIGAVLMYLVFYLPRFRTWFCFVAGTVFGGMLEYLLSWLQEIIFDTKSWDYSTYFLNIDGRTTIPYAMVWGLLVVVLARWICPFVDGVYRQMAERRANKLFLAVALFLAFDIFMSVAAVYRYNQREDGIPADSKVEEFLDRNFDDEKMKELYPSTTKVPD